MNTQPSQLQNNQSIENLPLKPQRSNKKTTAIIVLTILLLLAAGAGAWWYYFKQPKQTVCTMEVKLCPDGSYVGRTGPNCEFAPCPPIKR